MINKKSLLILALATLVVFGALGALISPYTREVGLLIFIRGVEPYWLQVIIGVGFGIITAKAGWQIVELPRLHRTKIFFTQLIKPLKLNYPEIIFISVCAGFGEELFFRGAIQPLLGVWLTSILFVMLHGYLNPFNMPLMYYGLYMVVVIGVMGLMTEYVGIITSMVAHTLIDIILLAELSRADIPEENDGES